MCCQFVLRVWFGSAMSVAEITRTGYFCAVRVGSDVWATGQLAS